MTEAKPDRQQKPEGLGRLGWIDRLGRIPFVQGLELADCGAACLAMVLGFFGRHESLSSTHQVLQPARDGVTARLITEAATAYGLVARALSVPSSAWRDLPRASILHWRFNHFVVFERIDRRGVWLLDPAIGRRRVDLEEFRRSFTGVALTFTAGEHFERRVSERGRTWDILGVILQERQVLLRVLLTSLVIQIIGLVFPALTSLIVDRVLPRGDLPLLNLVGLGVVLIIAGEGVAEIVRSYLLANLKVVVDARLTIRFFGHLLALPYAFFQRHSDGDLLMRLGSNATIREVLTGGILSALLDGTMVVGYLVILFAVKPLIGAIALCGTLLTFAPVWFTRTYRQELVARYLDARMKSESLEVEVLRAIETIKAMGLEPDTVERWSNLFIDTLNVDLTRDRVSALVRTFEEAVRAATPLVILLVGAGMALRGEVHAGEMLALSTLAALYISRVATLSASARSLQLLGKYVERIVEVMDTAVEASGRLALPLLKGEIVSQDLCFRYAPLAPLVVDNVSLRIRPGSAVAFVGGSGSGKSTLVKLLAGLYVPTGGGVRIDGLGLAEIDLKQYRKRIAVVTQETQLFAGSIRHNLAISAQEVSLNDIVVAAKLACIHDEIAAMPMGYETVLTDQGRSLSGGQRQRLALARALLRKPRVLLLDEATSAIDSLTEQRIKNNLDGLSCTRLVVAHRLSTIRDVEQIYVLSDGKLVAHGTHAELVAQRGLYFKLAEAQHSEG